MQFEISPKERDLLVDLVEGRIHELHPEIRRSMDHDYKDNLRQELRCFEELLSRLKPEAAAPGDNA
jgi:hypothetical protein